MSDSFALNRVSTDVMYPNSSIVYTQYLTNFYSSFHDNAADSIFLISVLAFHSAILKPNLDRIVMQLQLTFMEVSQCSFL